MRFSTSNHLLAFLASVAFSVSALPLSDISRTSVNLDATRKSLKSDSPRFTLTVHRTDDLVDEKAGTLIAERQVEIKMNFDVTSTGKQNSLLLNGVPVKAGISAVEVQVKAGMVVNRAQVTLPDGTISEEKEADVNSAFDVGLVTVKVFVRAVTMNVQLNAFLPPVPIRRFSLVERVIEINGKSVVQTDIGKQVFYFAPGGDFVGLVEDAKWGDISQQEESSQVATQSVQSSSMKCNLSRVRSTFNSWFKSLPLGLKFLIGSAWVTVGIFCGSFLASQIARRVRRARSGYMKVDAGKVAKTWPKSGYSDEKAKDMELKAESFDEGLPKYNSIHIKDKVPGVGDSENDDLCK